MITLKEADKIIKDNIRSFPAIKVNFTDAAGCVLQEDIKADRDLPAFNKALMDGVAIKAAAYKKGGRQFKIIGVQSAGTEALAIKKDDECSEIMTGAVCTKGADCVIAVEDLRVENNCAVIHDKLKVKRYLNIHPKGGDHKQGEILIKKGSLLGPAQLATAAAVGKAQIKVSVKPKIAVISTGDELVDIGQEVAPFQIRKSNSYFIKAALDKTGLFQTSTFHFQDNKKVLLRQISAIMEEFDALVVTGGISMGKFDFIPEVMRVLNVDILFQKVKQKPGKPFWYGKTKRNQPIFALPGNPLSTQIGLYRHVIPNLQNALSPVGKHIEYAQLSSSFKKTTPFSFFLLVKLMCSKTGQLLAEPVTSGSSGDFAASALADGFVELPASPQNFTKGYSARLFRF